MIEYGLSPNRMIAKFEGTEHRLAAVVSYSVGHPSFDPQPCPNRILCFCGMLWTHMQGLCPDFSAGERLETLEPLQQALIETCSGPVAASNWNKKNEFDASPKWRCCRPIFSSCDWRCLFGRDLRHRILSSFGLLFLVLPLLLWVVLPKWSATAGDSLVHVHRLKHVLGGKSMVDSFPSGKGKKNDQPPPQKKKKRYKAVCVFCSPKSPRFASLSSAHDRIPSLERHPAHIPRFLGAKGWNQRSLLRGLSGGPQRRATEEAKICSWTSHALADLSRKKDLGITAGEPGEPEDM